MSSVFTRRFDTKAFSGNVTVNTKLFINNEWVDPQEGGTIDVIDPVTGQVLTKASAGTSADVDRAVKAAREAFKTTWGLNCPGPRRGQLLQELVLLVEKHRDELAALEALDVGKPYLASKHVDLSMVAESLRYFSGWAGKVEGKTIESSPGKFGYTRVEPIGVVGQIIPWNFPLALAAGKLGPALATGCTVVLKPSEITPLSVLRLCDLIKEAGFPPGVVNVVNGYGPVAGEAISRHMDINKVSFTGSPVTGRLVAKGAVESNLKTVTLELGGKSPNIVFDDADVDQAVKWADLGIFYNAGQMCSAGSRIYVQEGIYDRFLERFKAVSLSKRLGDPFDPETTQGPQVSRPQLERVLGYINSGKSDGATVETGGSRHGDDGFFVEPTIFTDVSPSMKIAQEEIFGPVAVVVKFKTDEEVIGLANDTAYGLACAVFTQNIKRALNVAHSLEAGTAFINCYNTMEAPMPFGGYKTSGWGKELGEEALAAYTKIKAVHVNLGMDL
jgi:aldehyde dehydrogenase (NAD+)